MVPISGVPIPRNRTVVLLKRDCSNSIAINSVAIEAGSKRASFTWSCVVGPLPWDIYTRVLALQMSQHFHILIPVPILAH